MTASLLIVPLLTAAPQVASRPSSAGTEPATAPAHGLRAVPPIAWGDADGDGRADAFAILPSGAGVLLRCAEDRTLVDVTAGSGLELVGDVRRATWIDYDGDGLDDLFLLGPSGARLWRSHPGASFEDVTEATGLAFDAPVVSAAWVELDGDGLPDLHVTTELGDVLCWSSPGGHFTRVDVQLPGPGTGQGGVGLPLVESAAIPSEAADPSATPVAVPIDEVDRATPRAPGSGSSSTSTDASGSLSNPSPAGPEASSSVCLQSITDQATAACLMASSIPTLGMLYPLGPELFIDAATDNVGIGTTTPNHRLEVITAVSGGTAVRAASGSTTGVGQGVWGSSASPLGKGVLGIATNPSGVTTGVVGQAHSDQGQGVLGQSLGASGTTVGVRGFASSPDGIGVRGEHPSATGTAPGVLGETASAEHDAAAVLGRTTAAPGGGDVTYAVRGEAQATTGTAMGVAGSSSSADGVGVFGTTAVGGVGAFLKGAGVVGSTDVDAAAGVAGYDLSTNGGSGVLGNSSTADGVGVLGTAGVTEAVAVRAENLAGGEATALTAEALGDGATAVDVVATTPVPSNNGAIGVLSRAVGESGVTTIGVVGVAEESGTSIALVGAGAVSGATNIPGTAGVMGLNSETSGDTTGVAGVVSSSNGIGVYGESQAWHGLGVYGTTPRGTAVKGVLADPVEIVALNGAAVSGVAAEIPLANPAAGVFGLNEAGRTGVFGYSHDKNSITTLWYGWKAGVFGNSNWADGNGVRGLHLNEGDGHGVWGETTDDFFLSAGVRGTARADTGAGVWGENSDPSGLAGKFLGDIAATNLKSFAQPHPVDAGMEIRFVCLEGNESGTYFRGRTELVGGRAVIDVPEEFRMVTEPEGLTVQLTALGPSQIWVESHDLERVVIAGTFDVEVHYFVNGLRRGYADFQPVRSNVCFRPQERGVPYGTQYPDAIRRLLVENGTLNADFTPNESTAAENGWSLREPHEAPVEVPRLTSAQPQPQAPRYVPLERAERATKRSPEPTKVGLDGDATSKR